MRILLTVRRSQRAIRVCCVCVWRERGGDILKDCQRLFGKEREGESLSLGEKGYSDKGSHWVERILKKVCCGGQDWGARKES